MEDEFQVFEHPKFGKFRATVRKGEPWFVALDLCRFLKIDSTSNALKHLDPSEKDLASISTRGGKQQMPIVNKSVLYQLIVRSHKRSHK